MVAVAVLAMVTAVIAGAVAVVLAQSASSGALVAHFLRQTQEICDIT
jgi:hypothetical protein